MKRIQIAIPELRVTAGAELLEEAAPITCRTLWQALAKPMTERGLHAMWVGPEVMIDMPASHRTFDGSQIPPENQTSFPLPGDLIWFWFPAGSWNGLLAEIYEFGMVYGRNARMFIPSGWVAGNVFGRIDEHFEELAAALASFREVGRREITVSRAV